MLLYNLQNRQNCGIDKIDNMLLWNCRKCCCGHEIAKLPKVTMELDDCCYDFVCVQFLEIHPSKGADMGT